MIDLVTWPFATRFESVRHTRSHVTVAVTLFNYGDMVLSALESVRMQDLSDLDLVVVDDCSTDGGDGQVLDWLRTHRSRFGRCGLLQHLENQGLARARNQGFTWASTAFVLVLDADNQLYPRFASACLTVAETSHADAVTSLIEVFGDDKGVMGSDRWDPTRLQRGNYLDAMALVRRDAWQRVGGYRRMPWPGWEDYDFWLKCAEQDLHVTHLPEIVSRYRKSSASMLGTVTRQSRSVEELYEDIRLHHPSAVMPTRFDPVSDDQTSGAFAGPRRLDSRPLPQGSGETRAFMLVRDELRRLTSTLAHHRRLGVDRFFIVDNGSHDGTVDYLLEQPDVHVFQSFASYQQAHLGIDWLEQLLYDYGDARWCLLLDADEHLVYPDCESRSLREYCAALEHRGVDCLLTMFVDCYSDRPIAETHVEPGQAPLELCPFFDSSGYYRIGSGGSPVPRWYGGPRARLFWPEFDPSLTAHVGRAFDEEAYLSRHADVREAVGQGVFASGLEHFRLYGHAEERAFTLRQVDDWPETAYLRANPDVRRAVQAGTFQSGLDHFVRHGQFEPMRMGRGSAPPCLSQVPLVRWRSGMRLDVGRHQVHGVTWPREDVVGGALLHFRLMADLAAPARAVDAFAAPTEPSWALENERYRYVLQLYPGLCAMDSRSVRYQHSHQLTELALITPVSQL